MSEEKTTQKPDTAPKKPWPMSWIVIAILVYAVIHMLVTLLAS